MNLFATFQNDPFFSGIDLPLRTLPLDHRLPYDNNERQVTQRHQNDDQSLSVFNNPFKLMQNMMNQMESRWLSNDFTGDNGQGVSFSSSTIMSVDGRNTEQPRIFQATSEKLRGPEGR
jgi:hypothetical protein